MVSFVVSFLNHESFSWTSYILETNTLKFCQQITSCCWAKTVVHKPLGNSGNLPGDSQKSQELHAFFLCVLSLYDMKISNFCLSCHSAHYRNYCVYIFLCMLCFWEGDDNVEWWTSTSIWWQWVQKFGTPYSIPQQVLLPWRLWIILSCLS